jgi:hypothetical protein
MSLQNKIIVNSIYNVRVGRGDTLTGSYMDRDGWSLLPGQTPER